MKAKRIVVAAIGMLAVVHSVGAGAQVPPPNLPPPGGYKPIPNFTGTNVGAEFRGAINDRFSGIEPISPRVVNLPFASLFAAQDGLLLYCNDCQKINPCAPGGSGAWAHGTRGGWNCTSDLATPIAKSLGGTGNTQGADLSGYSGGVSIIGNQTNGSDQVSHLSVNGVANALAHGARANGVNAVSFFPPNDEISNSGNGTCSMTSGSTTITCAAGTFTNVSAGEAALVYGAGVAGATLVTTVSSVTNSSTAVLGNAASTTVGPNQSAFFATDDLAQINAAFAAARANNQVVYFPSKGNGGITFYYVSGPINWQGVSFYCDPGSEDASGSGFYSPVVIRGAPGKDVFRISDPADAGYTAPAPNYKVSNCSVEVDDSQDVSASNTHRKPGRTVVDTAMTDGSAVLTSNTADFEQGDVGQAVTVSGAGAAGATLTTTISSVQSSAQATLAASASTTATNATLYISLMGLSASQNVGNCAFAYDDRDGTLPANGVATIAPNGVIWDDIDIFTTGGGIPQNNSCAFFVQGNMAPYMNRFFHNFWRTTWGFVYAPANVNPMSGDTVIDLDDWDQLYFQGYYPFVAYNGNLDQITHVQTAAVTGPQMIAFGQTSDSGEVQPSGWTINLSEMEPWGGGPAATYGLRLAGAQHYVYNSVLSELSASKAPAAQWDANDSICKGCVQAGPVNVTGTSNELDFTRWSLLDALTDTGLGNNITFHHDITGNAPYTRAKVTMGGTPNFSTPVFSTHGSSVVDGNIGNISGGFYRSQDDLLIRPWDLNGQPDIGNFTWTTITDANSETGGAAVIPAGTGTLVLGNYYGRLWKVGDGIVPAQKIRVYIKGKADAAVTERITVAATTTVGQAPNFSNDIPCNWTTSYSICSGDLDLSSANTEPFFIQPFEVAGHTEDLAWIAIRPWANDTLTNSVVVGNPAGLSKGNASINAGSYWENGGPAMEYAITATGLLGALAANAVVATYRPSKSGQVVTLACNNGTGGACTTAPTVNIYDGTTNVGSAVTCSTTQQTQGADTQNAAEGLNYAAGDIIGIFISGGGASCAAPTFNVSATLMEN